MSYTVNVSTNIIRDKDKEIDYIVTPNAKEIFDRMFLHNYSAQKSFNLIGNYGTGKSTFLWALQKQLSGEKNFFGDALQPETEYKFIRCIGEDASLYSVLGGKLKLRGERTSEKILSSLERRRKTLEKKGKGLILVIDEFGKILEHVAKKKDTRELYLLQQISEWANDGENQVYFVITLHQSFTSYGTQLSSQEKLEWEKVKGRFTDLLFNEPVEQLLFFAAKRLEQFEMPRLIQKRFIGLEQLIIKSKLVGAHLKHDPTLSNALYPLDWLSANILVNSLQRYGQNERSLFSFLNDDNSYSIHQSESEFYSVPKVFDYLLNTIPSEISSPDNPHRAQWHSTFRALERIELLFEEHFQLASDIVKTIGLANIFSKAGGRFDAPFISEYFRLTQEVDITEMLRKMEKAGLIRFYRHSNKINFLEGTDLDLEQELISISKEINPNFGIAPEIERRIELPIVMAKKFSFQTGTSRFFSFRVLSKLKDVKDAEGYLDGYISLVFDDVSLDQLVETSQSTLNNIFVHYQNFEKIREVIFTIKKFDLLIEKHKSDSNAIKLLTEERLFYNQELQDLVLQQLFATEQNQWVYGGKVFQVSSKEALYQKLNEICFELYSDTPIFKNELINREHLSPPINAAKKHLIRAILENEHQQDLGFEEDRFPPEKSIYISLLREMGMHSFNSEFGYYELGEPFEESGIKNLWSVSVKFLESCKSNKRSLVDFYDALLKTPLKLKRGLIDFWIPIFLLTKKEDYALFHREGGFIPFLNEDTLDLINRKPQDFYIKSYNVSGLRLNLLEGYKELVQLNSNNEVGNRSTFLSIFSNFLRFQRSLNAYTLGTTNLSAEAIRLREAIVSAKDPERALFVEFPNALGYPNLSQEEDPEILSSYTSQLQSAIREIRTAFDSLVDRLEATLIEAFHCESSEFLTYKSEIAHKLRSVDPNALGSKQGIYLKRLISPLDDRESWLKSVLDVVLGKGIENLMDVEEPILQQQIKDRSQSLLKAADIHEYNKTDSNTRMYAFSLYEASGESLHDRFIIPDAISEKETEEETRIRKALMDLEGNRRQKILLDLLRKELQTKSNE
ncbi:ATP-binding protein [Robiginitalea biformata]|nr:ATP-binding protein [Robiginitalea biformata]